MSPKRRKPFKTALKLLLTAAALWWVFAKVPLHAVAALLAQIAWPWLLAGVLFFNLSKILSSVRLNRYFHTAGVTLGEWHAVILYYIGMFYNLFLPGGIGGDGYKIYLVQKHRGSSTRMLLFATLLDRLSGLVPLVILGALFFLISDFRTLVPGLDWVAALAAVASIPLLFLIQKRFFRAFVPIFRQTLLYGFGVQLLQVVSAYALLRALHVETQMTEMLFLFLLSSIVAVLPFTVGGVGARELVFLYGMRFTQSDPAMGVAFAMLFFLVTALSSLIGLFLENPLARGE